jgi:hypothetical protein
MSVMELRAAVEVLSLPFDETLPQCRIAQNAVLPSSMLIYCYENNSQDK